MTLDEAYSKIDGMSWKVNGVAGVLRVERINGLTEIVHHPSAVGKRSKKYLEVRRQLGDDYTTTITADFDLMGEIFAKVGM